MTNFYDQVSELERLHQERFQEGAEYFEGEEEQQGRRSAYKDGISASALMKMQFDPIRYIADGYIVEGLTILAGAPKIGKSWMALNLAVAVAAGKPVFGSVPCTHGDVLYLALEDNPASPSASKPFETKDSAPLAPTIFALANGSNASPAPMRDKTLRAFLSLAERDCQSSNEKSADIDLIPLLCAYADRTTRRANVEPPLTNYDP